MVAVIVNIGLAIVLGFAFAAMVYCIVAAIRNQRVFNYRMKKLELVSSLAYKDINEGREDWHRWYDLLDTMNYEEMVWKIWRTLDSFCPFILLQKTREAEGWLWDEETQSYIERD